MKAEKELRLESRSWEEFFYRLVGRRFEKLFEKNKKFKIALRAAYIQKTPGQYFAEAFSKAVLLGVALGVNLAFLFSFLYYITTKNAYLVPLLFLTLAVPFTILGTLAILVLYYINPFLAASSRKERLNKEYPFVMRYLEALSATGLPPAALFQMLAESKVYPESAKEARRITAMLNSGYDIITALLRAAEYCPSPMYRRFYISLASTIQAGGSLEMFFKLEAERAQKLIELRYKDFENTLALVVQMLIMVVIVFPLLTFSVMLPIKMFQNVPAVQQFLKLSLPIDPGMLILFMSYVLTPMMIALFVVLIRSSAP
ncbi:MAG: hypothetical protein GXO42_02915 [bacterium]|nr:hypothetical protein [bacterium]